MSSDPYPASTATAPPTESFWLQSAGGESPRAPLRGTVACDVAVLGGGMAGICASYELAQAGVAVVLLEADSLGAGATGHTTAKVSAAHGLRLERLRSAHDAATAHTYARLNQAAIARIAQIARDEDVAADMRERSAYLYATTEDGAAALADEVAVAADAGLDAELLTETPLPITVLAAMRVRNQAEFHPVRWLRGVARAAERRGARLFENSRALSVRHRPGSETCMITTSHGAVTAGHVIVATHYPTLDRGLFFARMGAQRSLCIAARAARPAPEGMFLSVDGPTRSLRSHVENGEEILIVGGEGYAVGATEDVAERYAALEAWARTHLDVDHVTHRWAAQDPVTPDGLPYVGAINPFSERVLVATGFAKWGMTNALVAAQALRDRVTGTANPDAEILDSNRFDAFAAARGLVGHNAGVARHFVGDRLSGTTDARALRPGEGSIVRSGLRRLAAYRDAGGDLHAFSASCTHLGCELRFNDAERSWDCPCHGSRFDARDGRVLEGPAVHPLSPADGDALPSTKEQVTS